MPGSNCRLAPFRTKPGAGRYAAFARCIGPLSCRNSAKTLRTPYGKSEKPRNSEGYTFTFRGYTWACSAISLYNIHLVLLSGASRSRNVAGLTELSINRILTSRDQSSRADYPQLQEAALCKAAAASD